MRDDDDALAGVDLAAWQPPPPPADLASAVVARLREPAPAAALDPHERTSRRPRWIGGLAAAAAAAVAAVWFTRAPPPSRGVQIATRAEHLALDGSVADLDAGAELRWDRDRHRITAHQARGIVRWTVADDDTLVIVPGGQESTATMEASGASLRVEVQMNLSDMRLVGASTLTAASVAVVTVVVYMGHVKATSGGQTVTVTPGSTVELRPQAPPREVAEPRPEPPVVGGSPAEVQRLEAQLRAANDKVAALTAELAARPADAIEVTPIALEAFRLRGDRNIVPDEATRLAIARAGITKVIGSYKLCVDTRGAVASIKLLQSTRFAAYDRRIEQAILGWTYRPFLSGGKPTPVCTAVTFIYDSEGRPAPAVDRSRAAAPDAPTVPEAGCATVNVGDLLAEAANQYASGYARAALALVTKALACKQDIRMYRVAVLYACVGRDADTAHQMYRKLPAQHPAEPEIEQKCQQEGINLQADP